MRDKLQVKTVIYAIQQSVVSPGHTKHASLLRSLGLYAWIRVSLQTVEPCTEQEQGQILQTSFLPKNGIILQGCNIEHTSSNNTSTCWPVEGPPWHRCRTPATPRIPVDTVLLAGVRRTGKESLPSCAAWRMGVLVAELSTKPSMLLPPRLGVGEHILLVTYITYGIW